MENKLKANEEKGNLVPFIITKIELKEDDDIYVLAY